MPPRRAGSGRGARPRFSVDACGDCRDLDWVLEGYLDAFEDIELALEELDSRTMQGALTQQESALRRLVEFRQAIGRLRRALVSHREMFLALTRPELEAMLNHVATAYDNQVSVRLQSMTALMEPVLIVMMGTMTGGIVVSILMPLMQISEFIQ